MTSPNVTLFITNKEPYYYYMQSNTLGDLTNKGLIQSSATKMSSKQVYYGLSNSLQYVGIYFSDINTSGMVIYDCKYLYATYGQVILRLTTITPYITDYFLMDSTASFNPGTPIAVLSGSVTGFDSTKYTYTSAGYIWVQMPTYTRTGTAGSYILGKSAIVPYATATNISTGNAITVMSPSAQTVKIGPMTGTSQSSMIIFYIIVLILVIVIVLGVIGYSYYHHKKKAKSGEASMHTVGP